MAKKKIPTCKKRDLFIELSFDLRMVTAKIDVMKDFGIWGGNFQEILKEESDHIDLMIAELSKVIYVEKCMRKEVQEKKEVERKKANVVSFKTGTATRR